MREFWTPKQLASLLNVTVRQLEIWRMTNDGPPFVKMGRKSIRYRPEAVEAWLAAREFSNTAEARHG